MDPTVPQYLPGCSSCGSHYMGLFAQVLAPFLRMAGCAIFTPWRVPFRRLVVFVLLIVVVAAVVRAPAILQAMEPLLR